MIEPGEERLGQPLVEEGVDADGLDAVGQRLVGRAPSFSFPSVVHAPRRADQDKAPDGVGSGEGRVQAQAPAHGVAHVGRTTTGGRKPRTTVDQIQIKVAGGTVSRRVTHETDGGGLVLKTSVDLPGTNLIVTYE